MKVLKFGGTSVGSVDSIKQVAAILSGLHKKKQKFVVVCSAMSGVTNTLVELGQKASTTDISYTQVLKTVEQKHVQAAKILLDVKAQSKAVAQVKVLINELQDLLHGIYLLKELSPRTNDLLLSFGERLSCYLVAEYVKQEGIPVEFLDARDVIKTDANFGNARVDFRKTDKLIKEYIKDSKHSIVVTGFIASTDKNETTTLGRGGSDYTASIFGAAVDTDAIEIWTDVDGVMTADPRKVKSAFTLEEVSYVEMMELSHFGAKVIYPPTLQPAFKKRIPIWIKNTFNPEFVGTLISEKTKNSNYLVKGVTSIENISLLNLTGSGMVGVPGVSGRLFGALARHQVNVVLITQASSEHSICFVIDSKDTNRARIAVEEEFTYEIQQSKIDKLVEKHDLAIVAIVGDNMRNTPGISGKLFGALGKNGINVVAIAQGSSEINLSVVIPKADLTKALNIIHESFFISDTKDMNVFIVGVGLIGSTLIKQIQKQAAYLLKEKNIKINIVGLANSRKMLIQPNGIALTTWKDKVENGEKADMKSFVQKMIELNLPNTIFVDNTSHKDVVIHYHSILDASISVVTPNKLANSGLYKEYKKLQETAFKRRVKFLYETNVGAGLPVISTLNDLKDSGDKIIRIEGILSGTLSYIFNTFKGDKKFSDVVKEAKEKGYTEPDPRDDLNGKDVARKILILSREAGFNLEMEDVVIENILPAPCLKAKTVEEFFLQLEKNNEVFAQRRAEADKANKVLRFIAKLENGKATVSLLSVDAAHPFYSLSGSDNMISYTTERYKDRPLVIKGPGAGAEVTAAGVFADILRISNYLKG
ncbi:MAG: bifunctional aspartate kinase/homoserine dehydrogenase I [Cytophagaceae bacterium]|jgi:aspartokinase/homoserine dehydrogenase 1|nr:bifunctional aspartate kinase/homoserine dehydrogenase I [Cytophagaceae bacterium]